MMRHAVSQNAGPTRDHDRPILPEGARAAAEVRGGAARRGARYDTASLLQSTAAARSHC